MIRKVTKDYQVPDSKIVFDKGMTVLISIYAIHHDSEFYQNPEEFDPERFTQENVSKRHPMAFIPFGEGENVFIALFVSILQNCVYRAADVRRATLWNDRDKGWPRHTPIQISLRKI